MNMANASRSQLSRIPGLNRAIDFIVARANVVFGAEHDNETGAHTNITAKSVTVAVGPDATGTIALESGAPPSGNTVTIENTNTNGFLTTIPEPVDDSRDPVAAWAFREFSTAGVASELGARLGRLSGGVGTGASGIGLELDGAAADNTRKWVLMVSDDNFNDSIGFYDVTDAVEVLKLYRVGASSYVLAPSEDGIATVKLGDSTDSDLRFDECAANKFFERNDAGLGYWTSVAYSAFNFMASAGTWTVDVGDQITYAYTIVGKTMTLAWNIQTTDVSAGSVLRLAIPGGYTAVKLMAGVHLAQDAGGAFVSAACRVLAAGTYVELYATAGFGNWSITAADATGTLGTFTFEVA